MKRFFFVLGIFLFFSFYSFGQVSNSKNLKKVKTFDQLYYYLIKLQDYKLVNYKLLEKINDEFNKNLILNRKQKDVFRNDIRFWNYSAYPFFDKIKNANQDSLSFNLFEFVIKIRPYYFATGEVEQGLSILTGEIAYKNINSFVDYISKTDSVERVKILKHVWWPEHSEDSLKIKLKNSDVYDDIFNVSNKK